jgi:hypothetical protein
MHNITLTTVGQKIGERTNARKPDLDHARTIIEYLERGYRITAKAKDTPMWSVSFSKGPDGKLFSNQKESDDDTINYMKRVNYGIDDGRLHDNQPDWVAELIRLSRSISGAAIHWH